VALGLTEVTATVEQAVTHQLTLDGQRLAALGRLPGGHIDSTLEVSVQHYSDQHRKNVPIGRLPEHTDSTLELSVQH